MKKSLSLCCFLLLVAGFEQGVEAQWKKVSVFTDAEGTPSVHSLAHLKNGLYAVQDSVLLRSTDKGGSWQKLSDFPHMCALFSREDWTIAANDSPLYVTGGYHGMSRGPFHRHFARSTDGGISWRDTSTFLGQDYPGLSVLRNGRVVMAHSGWRNSIIHFSTNGGVSWDSTASAGLPVGAGVNNVISNGSFLILSAVGDGESNEFLYRSTDYGESWVQINTGVSANGYRNLLLLGNSLFALAYSNGWNAAHGILSTNGGLTWAVAPNPTMDGYDSQIWTDGKSLFGHSESSPLVVAGIGEPWRNWSDGVPPHPYGWMQIQSLAFSDSLAFALLWLAEPYRQEVWRRPLTELLSGASPDDHPVNPTEFRLLQNYPNPFNPTTVISYQLPVLSCVKLTVFDMLGREVRVLVNEGIDAGVHEVRFDGSGLSSGMYVYRLRAGEYVATKRMLLMK